MIAAAIILAAGRGARMGGPKALLSLRGRPLIVQHLARLEALGCGEIVVAVPRALEETVRVWTEARIRVLGLDTRTQAESLTAALATLERDAPLPADAIVLVTPVDLLPPRLETLRTLVAAVAGGAAAAVPRHADRPGHPVLLRAATLAPYRAAGDPLPLRTVIAACRRQVEVDDPAVLGDLDAPEDLTALS